MAENKVIILDQVKNQVERDILLYLKRNGKSLYGNILKELRLPASKGQQLIHDLVSRGYIKRADKPSFLELNGEMK